MYDRRRQEIDEIMARRRREMSSWHTGTPPTPPVIRTQPARWHWLLWAIGVLTIALAMVIGAGVWGYLDGLKDRTEWLRTQALEHYRAGVAQLEEGNYELAQAEFEQAIRLQPEMQPAWEKLREAQRRALTISTPTSIPLPSPAPSPPATAPSSVSTTELDRLLTEAQESYRKAQYTEAIALVERLISIDPTYQQEMVRDLLFNCYYRQALGLISQERFEEAVRQLDAALALRPEDTQAREERDLASGYMAGLGFWGADWEKASEAFAAVYAIRADYRDVAGRLVAARAEQGEFLASKAEWCQAAQWYTLALAVRHDPQLAARQQELAENCQTGVPAPTQHIEAPTATPAPGEEDDTGGHSMPTTSPAGLRALGLNGRVYYAVYDRVRKEYVMYAASVDGDEVIEIVAGMHQPRVNRTGTHLVARARSGVKTLGLYLIDLTSGLPPTLTMITSHVDDLYASFSPNGQRIVFASNRMSQRLWTLFATWVDGHSDLETITQGHTPAWSPTDDRIAYKGCDPTGNNCGIWLVASNGADPTRLVSDPSAGFPSWSPDGKQIAFMSNRDGHWDIYAVNVDGSGLRRLTRSPSSEGLPTWSPDGKAIAYLSDRDGKWEIYLQRVDSGLTAKLVTLETIYEDWLLESLAWGPADK